MSESVFDIFGDLSTRQVVKNVSRQPLLCNIENMGKNISSGPIKPNEPVKKTAEVKKSFLSNAGKALQSTPLKKVFTPRTVNVGAMIYNDAGNDGFNFEDLEFTKPSYQYDNYHRDLFDYLPLPEPEVIEESDVSPPDTPPPAIKRPSMELDCSYEDEFFTDDFYTNISTPYYESDLELPDLY